jgi:tetratricopeptide (TPR) repeat protein
MTKPAQEELEQLEEAFAEGDEARARSLVASLYKAHGDDVRVAVAQARLLAADGQVPKAIARLEALAKTHKQSGLPRAYKGALLSFVGEHKKAVSEIEAARKKPGGEVPAALHGLGVSLLALGRAKDALPVLQQAASAMPRSASTLFSLGQGFEAVGDLKNAQLAYVRCVDAEPRYEGAFASLVRVHALAGDLELAQSTVREGLKHNPDDVELMRFGVQVCFDKNDPAAARRALLVIPEARRDLDDLANLALLFVQAGESDEAERYARQAVAHSSEDWRPYWLLGLALEGKDPFPRAAVIEAYEQALVRGDPAGEAGTRLGLVLLSGDEAMPDIAAEILEDARGRNPEHAGAILHLAFARANQGQRDEAKALAAEVLQSPRAGEQERAQAQRLLEALGS